MRRMLICVGTFTILMLADTNAQEGKDNLKAGVIGKWISRDAEKKPLEFFKDGTAKVAFVKKDDAWIIATGTWTVNGKGRVDFKGRTDSVTLGLWWNFKDGLLVMPRGSVTKTWEKVKSKDSK